MSAFRVSDPARRNYPVALLVGLIAGAFSAIVKFGWEVPFPPRTPERNVVNPPQTLLEQIGFPESVARATVNLMVGTYLSHLS